MNQMKSSLEIAVEAAAKVDSRLARKGAIKPNPVVVAFKKAGKSLDEIFSTEFEINEFPLSIRNLLTKNITQEEIHCFSGATIATRGRFIPAEDLWKPKFRGEKPLYLSIQGPNKQSIDLALQRIETLIADATMDPLQSKYKEKVLIGLENAPPSFDVRGKVMGPGGANLQYITNETGAIVTVRGRGSGFLEPTTGQESIEPLHICVEHSKYEVLQAGRQLAFNLIETVQQEWVNIQQQQQQQAMQQPMTIQLQQPYNPTGHPNQLIVNGAGEMSGMVTVPVFSQQAMGQIVSVPPPGIAVPPPPVHLPPQQQPIQIGLQQGQQNISALVQGPPPQIQQQQQLLQHQQLAGAAQQQQMAAVQQQQMTAAAQQQLNATQHQQISATSQAQQHHAQQQLAVSHQQQQSQAATGQPGASAQNQQVNNQQQTQQPQGGHQGQQQLATGQQQVTTNQHQTPVSQEQAIQQHPPPTQLLPTVHGQQVYVSGGAPLLGQPQLQPLQPGSLVQPQLVTQTTYPVQYMQTSSGQMVVAYPSGAGGRGDGTGGGGAQATGTGVMLVQYQGAATAGATRTAGSRLGSQLVQVVNPQTGQVVPTQVLVPPPQLISPQQLHFLQPQQHQMLIAQPQLAAGQPQQQGSAAGLAQQPATSVAHQLQGPQIQAQLGMGSVQHIQLQGMAPAQQSGQQQLQAIHQHQIQPQLHGLVHPQSVPPPTPQLQQAQQHQQLHVLQHHQLQQQLQGLINQQNAPPPPQGVPPPATSQQLQQNPQQQSQQGQQVQHQQGQQLQQQPANSVQQVGIRAPPPPQQGQKRRFEGEQNQFQTLPPQPVPPPNIQNSSNQQQQQNRKGIGRGDERGSGVSGSGAQQGSGGGGKPQANQDDWKDENHTQDRMQTRSDKPDQAKRGRTAAHQGEGGDDGTNRCGAGGAPKAPPADTGKITYNHYSSKPQLYNAQLPFHLQGGGGAPGAGAYPQPPPHPQAYPPYYQQPPQYNPYNPWMMPP